MTTPANASGDKLDKLLAGLDLITTRMDAVETKVADKKDDDTMPVMDADAFGKMLKDAMEGVNKKVGECMDSLTKRMDAVEAKDRKDSDAEEALKKEREANELKKNDEDKAKEAKDRKDAEEADKVKKDAEEKERMDRNDAQAKELATIKGQNETLLARLATIESHVTDAASEDRTKFTAIWNKGEELHQFFGDSNGQQRWAPGEHVAAYERRVYGKFKKHSARWKDIDLDKITDPAVFSMAATEIFNDAQAAAAKASDLPVGNQLRQVEIIDKYSGAKRIEFRGDDDGATWEPFCNVLKIGKFGQYNEQSKKAS